MILPVYVKNMLTNYGYILLLSHFRRTLGEIYIIRTIRTTLKENIKRYSVDEQVVLGLTISVFISIYVTVAAMIFVVLYLIKRKRLKSVSFATAGTKYIWMLCILGVVAAFINDNGIGILFTMLLAVYILIGAFARSVMNRRLFDSIIKTSCVVSLLSFAIALIQYATFGGYADRVCSVFVNANYYAAVIEIVVLFAVYKLCRAKDPKQRGFYAVVVAMNAVGLYFTGCRAAIFVLFATISLMLLLNRRYKALAIYIGSCILFTVLVAVVPNVFPRMNDLNTDMETRIEIWRRAFEDIAKHPIFGEGTLAYFGLHFVVDGNTIVHTHSIYLELILSFGILGILLILIYLKKTLRPIWIRRKTKTNRDRFVLVLGLLCSIAMHGIVDLTAFGVQTGILLILVFAMAGIHENRQIAPIPLPASYTVYLRKTG